MAANTFLIAEHKEGQLKRVTLEILGRMLKTGNRTDGGGRRRKRD